MGEYAAIHGLIRNITVNEVENYLSKRYGSPIMANRVGGDFGTILNMFPEFYMAQVFESENNVILNGCQKYGSFRSGMEKTMSFYVIADICRRLGDSEVRSSGIDDISDEEDLEDCELIAQYSERERPDLRSAGMNSFGGTKRLYRYYLKNVARGNRSKEIKMKVGSARYESEQVPEIVYRQAGVFFRSWKPEDIKAFYNTCHIAYWCWCTDREGWEDLRKITVDDFIAFVPELTKGDILIDASALEGDIPGFSEVFERVGNKEVSEYCKKL